MEIITTHMETLPNASRIAGLHLCAVLTRDAQGLYAVYVGAGVLPDPTWETTYGEIYNLVANYVAHSGKKLRFADALAYFRGLQANEYRA
jgi:hypothetical protein